MSVSFNEIPAFVSPFSISTWWNLIYFWNVFLLYNETLWIKSCSLCMLHLVF